MAIGVFLEIPALAISFEIWDKTTPWNLGSGPQNKDGFKIPGGTVAAGLLPEVEAVEIPLIGAVQKHQRDGVPPSTLER
ncbi:hypothetical protein D6833_04460, partial [Candidatus Parcubacteria bacterium]